MARDKDSLSKYRMIAEVLCEKVVSEESTGLGLTQHDDSDCRKVTHEEYCTEGSESVADWSKSANASKSIVTRPHSLKDESDLVTELSSELSITEVAMSVTDVIKVSEVIKADESDIGVTSQRAVTNDLLISAPPRKKKMLTQHKIISSPDVANKREECVQVVDRLLAKNESLKMARDKDSFSKCKMIAEVVYTLVEADVIRVLPTPDIRLEGRTVVYSFKYWFVLFLKIILINSLLDHYVAGHVMDDCMHFIQ